MARRCRPCGTHKGAGWGRQGSGEGREEAARPGSPPPYPLLGSSSLGVIAARGDLQKLDDADAAGRDVAAALRGAALPLQVL